MLPKAATQLIAQHLSRHRRPHLLGAVVGVTFVVTLLSLGSGSANAYRSEAQPSRFLVPLYIPEIQGTDYTLAREPNWQELTIQRGDTLTSLLQRVQLSSRDVARVIEDKSTRHQLRNLTPGKKFRLQVLPGDNARLLGIDYSIRDDRILSVRLDDDGHYYSVVQQPEYEHRMRYTSGEVVTSPEV